MTAWRVRTAPLADQARAAWQQRTRREQRLIGVGTLLVLAALLWVLGVRPAWQSIQQGQDQLPVLQARAAQLDAVILEARALGQGRQGTLSEAEARAAVQAGLRESDLASHSTFSELDNAGQDAAHWQVSFANAPSAPLMAWLAGLPAIAQVRVYSLALARSNVDGRDRPGQLSGTVVLALPSGGDS